uniref:MULE transposase domain-containing protein n=1 Tax=Ditylenchus dipsaci TaxID=166011 RepID=A0A915E0X7_9BILA
MTEENRAMRLTLRGAEAINMHFGEHLVLYGDNEMLMFSSPRQLRLLYSCSHIISDGTLKYAPKSVMQIYRISGLVHQLHASPVMTVLMKQKNADLYKRMWEKAREALLQINVVNSISFANFDAGIAAYLTFAEVFPGVSVKLCSFHVKQGAIARAIARKRNQFRSAEAGQDARALQITPIVGWLPGMQMLRVKINNGTFDEDLAEKLEELLVYFEGLAQEISEEEAQLNVVFDAE